MVKLEKRVKRFTFLMLFFGLMSIFVIMFIGGKFLIKKEKERYLSIAKNKIYLIEKDIDDFLISYATISDYIINDNVFKVLYQNKSDNQCCLENYIQKNEFMISIGYIDTNGTILFKIQKDIYNNVILLKDQLNKNKYQDILISEVKKSKKLIYSTMYTVNPLQNPISTIYVPIFNKKENIIGFLFSEFDITPFINQTLFSDIFDVYVYNSSGSIIFNSIDGKIIELTQESSKLSDIYFDYREMLIPKIYNNGETVSKLLILKHNVHNGIGIQLKFNNRFNNQIENAIIRIYYIYLLTTAVFLIFVGIMIKKYISDSIKFDELYKYSLLLESINKQLKQNSLIDNFTGLGNKPYYKKKINELFSLFLRHNQIFSIIIFSINGLNVLKYDKNELGSFIEDDLIKMFVESIKVFVRDSDIFLRLDRNTFVILLPNTDKKLSDKFTIKMVEYLKNIDCNFGEHKISITINISNDAISEKDTTPYTLYKRVLNNLKITDHVVNKICSI